MVVAAKGLVAVRTFTRPRCQALINAFFAEHMSAGLDHGVFKVALADGANRECLI